MDICQRLKIHLILSNLGGELLASGGWRLGILLNIFQAQDSPCHKELSSQAWLLQGTTIT